MSEKIIEMVKIGRGQLYPDVCCECNLPIGNSNHCASCGDHAYRLAWLDVVLMEVN